MGIILSWKVVNKRFCDSFPTISVLDNWLTINIFRYISNDCTTVSWTPWRSYSVTLNSNIMKAEVVFHAWFLLIRIIERLVVIHPCIMSEIWVLLSVSFIALLLSRWRLKRDGSSDRSITRIRKCSVHYYVLRHVCINRKKCQQRFKPYPKELENKILNYIFVV